MTPTTPTTSERTEHRWRSRPVLGALTRLVIFAGPIVVGISTTTLIVRLAERPTSTGWTAMWWIGVFIVSTATIFLGDRVFRRLMPLAALFRLTLLFPDTAPSRFRVANSARNADDLRDELESLQGDRKAENQHQVCETIIALVAALSTHDRQTRGHSERVAVYADLLAQEMKLTPAARDRLRWAALLHDIGKLTVEPDVLNDTGRPEPWQWEELKGHPHEGAKLASPILPWLGDWGRAIEEHHERFDGEGYPRGLSGEQISRGARIVSVADSYDAMTSGRPYRRPLSPHTAREEIAKGAGKAYDPKVCRALMSASIGGRGRRVLSMLVWLGQLPFSLGLDRFGQVVAGVVQASGGAAAAVIGTVAITTASTAAPPAAAAPSTPPAPIAAAPIDPAPTSTPSPKITATPVPSSTERPTPTPSAQPVPAATPKPTPTPTPCSDADGAIAPSMDAYIGSDEIDANHVDDTTLSVQSKLRLDLPPSASSENRRTLIAFASPEVPDGCELTAATLRLYSSASTDDRTIEAWGVEATWTESGVTWTNQPATSHVVARSPSGPGWRTWNVSASVRSSAGAASISFLLKDADEDNKGFTQTYVSREAAANRPSLVFTLGER